MSGTLKVGGKTLATHDTNTNVAKIQLGSTSDVVFTDSAGNNVLSESGGVVTLTTDEANVGSNALVVNSSGNVGIGTTSPSYPLHISGTGHKRLKIEKTDAGGDADLQISSPNDSTGWILFHDNNAGNNSGVIKYVHSTNKMHFRTNDVDDRLVISADGNVGIGTSSPSDYYANRLVVTAGYADGITIAADTTTDVNYLMFDDGGGSVGQGWVAYYHNGNALTFGSNSYERMRIDSSGNINLSNNYNFARVRPTNSITFADDASIQVTSATCGSSIVSAYDFASGHGISCFVCYASTAIIVGNSTNGANSDTDGKICIFKSANSHTTYVKNRLGSTKTFSVSVIGAYTHS